ncbi:MAG: ribonuclease E/G, partial [Alphaproteobacteria bacterium]|nr:ribonuclease E/G [Alphaproteobacteria bacterium]
MTKRMLIDASHAEETRVVVLDGNRLEDFDLETATKRQLKGNIYLAKIVRIEPSLQAAFVEYGGNRHGFLAFTEIHPDYYQIPVADRQRLLDMQAEQARAEEEAEEAAAEAAGATPAEDDTESAEAPDEDRATPPAAEAAPASENGAGPEQPDAEIEPAADPDPIGPGATTTQPARIAEDRISGNEVIVSDDQIANDVVADVELEESVPGLEPEPGSAATGEAEATEAEPMGRVTAVPVEVHAPETVGGEADGAEEAQERRVPPRFLRNYKLQEVIRRRQIMLVQVVKEERGNKGAALTTYISLAGRYCVLMPNS